MQKTIIIHAIVDGFKANIPFTLLSDFKYSIISLKAL